jgi:L-fuconolactonase
VVDAHHHFWRRDSDDVSWLLSAHQRLNASFGPDELRAQLAEAGVDATVLIQATNTAAETERVLRYGEEADFVSGVVAWAPLERPDDVDRVIERCREYAQFCGFRHIITREPEPDWLLQDTVVRSLRKIAAVGATFDVVAVTPRHLENVATLARVVPELRLVIDHLGRPPIEGTDLEPWMSLIAAAARFPTVYAKVSVGLDVLERMPGWTADLLRPFVDHALACFGPNRLMIASNWPVCLLGYEYSTVWRETTRSLSGLSESERTGILGGTARTFYGL